MLLPVRTAIIVYASQNAQRESVLVFGWNANAKSKNQHYIFAIPHTSPGNTSPGPKSISSLYDNTTIAKLPTMSCMAVSNGPPHFPASRWNTKVNNSGASVPVSPAVKIDNTWATPTVIPNTGSRPAAKNAMVPITQPMADPSNREDVSSILSHFEYVSLVTCKCDTARVVNVEHCSPQFPDIALVSGKNAISS